MTILTIGFTVTDRDNDYVPTMDGWRPNAKQEVVTLEVADLRLSIEAWANAVYVVTNAPPNVTYQDGANQVANSILFQRGPVPRSLSIGDTVTVDGRTVECTSIGWREVVMS